MSCYFAVPLERMGERDMVDPELAAQMKKKFRMEYGLE